MYTYQYCVAVRLIVTYLHMLYWYVHMSMSFNH